MLARGCSRLEEVHFRDMGIDSSAFELLMINNSQTLRVVDLLGCHTVSGQDVRSVAACTNLTDLSLWGCHNVDNASILHVVETCAQLQRLNLRYCHKVNDRYGSLSLRCNVCA